MHQCCFFILSVAFVVILSENNGGNSEGIDASYIYIPSNSKYKSSLINLIILRKLVINLAIDIKCKYIFLKYPLTIPIATIYTLRKRPLDVCNG